MKKILNFLKSVKLTIFLLFFLAIACTIGTLLPQNEPPQVYVREFGSVGAKLINTLVLYDVYHSPWFQFLLVFFSVNLIVCSLERWPKTWRLYRLEKKVVDKKFFEHLPLTTNCTTKLSLQEAKEKILNLLKKEHGKLSTIEDNPGFTFHLKKGHISYLGPYIIHAGILIVLIGALISSIFGFSGMMFIAEGERSNTIFLEGRKHHQLYNLPFSLKCDKFVVEYYKNGMPKEYRSHITVIDQDKKFKTTIKVNSPLDYKGYRFYQADFGVASNPTIRLAIIERETGKKFYVTIPFDKEVPLPHNLGTIRLVNATSDLRNLGPAFLLLLTRPHQKKKEQIILLSNFPEFDAMHRKDKYVFVVKDFTRYTGLEVRKDPGTWIVWLGCLVLIGGLMISFFIIPQRLWVRLEPCGKECQVWIGGMSGKRKEAFKAHFAKWTREIKEILACK